jgi:hypothetical protein
MVRVGVHRVSYVVHHDTEVCQHTPVQVHVGVHRCACVDIVVYFVTVYLTVLPQAGAQLQMATL